MTHRAARASPASNGGGSRAPQSRLVSTASAAPRYRKCGSALQVGALIVFRANTFWGGHRCFAPPNAPAEPFRARSARRKIGDFVTVSRKFDSDIQQQQRFPLLLLLLLSDIQSNWAVVASQLDIGSCGWAVLGHSGSPGCDFTPHMPPIVLLPFSSPPVASIVLLISMYVFYFLADAAMIDVHLLSKN